MFRKLIQRIAYLIFMLSLVSCQFYSVLKPEDIKKVNPDLPSQFNEIQSDRQKIISSEGLTSFGYQFHKYFNVKTHLNNIMDDADISCKEQAIQQNIIAYKTIAYPKELIIPNYEKNKPLDKVKIIGITIKCFMR